VRRCGRCPDVSPHPARRRCVWQRLLTCFMSSRRCSSSPRRQQAFPRPPNYDQRCHHHAPDSPVPLLLLLPPYSPPTRAADQAAPGRCSCRCQPARCLRTNAAHAHRRVCKA
jgi:hypothetical protein